MTATLQDLYDDIKELIHQKFETKTEEDTTLPEIVESYFNYNQGELDIDIPHMKLKVTGSSFETYSSTPFAYTGEVFVDWGDDSELMEYTGGKLSHTFNDGLSNHTIRVYGDLTSLGASCFENCIGLTSINIPDNVISLESYCFKDCSGLTSIILPNSISSLGVNCFNHCTSLTSITLPNSILSLGIFCFNNCNSLTSISLNWTGNNILTYQSNWIQSTISSLKFIIPQETTEDYVQAGYPSDKLVESD